ncbi:hypothetical protein [Pseudomonas sp. LD120]|uniref:DUF7079 family protein n=1 Tax=Pseudomonas sp. LD120 TaxID=485751 RepID=UPI00135C9D3B|nr:hypothetical protein [Pseudomonas sp. LD120]KAF0864932.1 hypothetical protein PLD_06460 [Pseudomonas sp. LD120]
MSSAITPEQLADIRYVLSDAFVDNEVDYAYIARETQAFDRAEVERILYEEVAPVCYINLMAVIPEIWMGFAREPLLEEIEASLALRRRSRWQAFRVRLLIRWIRFRGAYIWAEICKHYAP